jgi:hypothetical protein
MDTCYGVKIHATKAMRDGDRKWSVPSFAYYAGRKSGQLQQTTNHYAAMGMTQSLAAELIQKLNAAGLEATVCDLFADPDALIHDTMASIGEEAPPPAPPPSTLVDLAKAIAHCFRRDGLSPLEVLTYCCRVVLNG